MIKVHQSISPSKQLAALIERLNKYATFHDFEIFSIESTSVYQNNHYSLRELFTESNAAFAIHANYDKHDTLYYGGLGAVMARSKFLGVFLAGGEETPKNKIQIFFPQKTLNCPAFCAKLVHTFVLYFERRFSDKDSISSLVEKIDYPAALKFNANSEFTRLNFATQEPFPYYITWDEVATNPKSVIG